MIEQILDGIPNAERKGCVDCKHCKAAVSWWCTNKEAIKHKNSSLPYTKNCSFWEPCRTKKDLTLWEKISPFSFFEYIVVKEIKD